MQNHNKQQQAVILKGIAQQILSMNIPTFEVVGKLFEEFGIDFEGNKVYTQMYHGIGAALSLSDEIKGDLSITQHRIAHLAMKPENDSVFKLRNAIIDASIIDA